jgi:hypothetical protein
VFSFFYFTWASAYGYYTFKDAPWLPPDLGGHGSWDKMTEDAPFVPMVEGAVTYAMLQLGYHGGDLVHHILFAERQNDFAEMLMHHIAAVSVLTCMIFANWMSIGCTIAFLHDIADITTAIAKFLGASNLPTMTLFLGLASNMIVWGYTRNYLLAIYLYKIWTEYVDVYPPEYAQYSWVTYGAAIMLTGMLCLHYYWYMIFI